MWEHPNTCYFLLAGSLGTYRYLNSLKERFNKEKKMVASNLGKYTALFLSINKSSPWSGPSALQNHTILLAFPLKHHVFHASGPFHMQDILFGTPTPTFSSFSVLLQACPLWNLPWLWRAVSAFLNFTVLCVPLSLPLPHCIVIVYLSVFSDSELPEARRPLEGPCQIQVCAPGAWHKMKTQEIFVEWRNNEPRIRVQ